MSVNNYKTEGSAARWGKYYQNKHRAVTAFVVRPHPTDFGFAIYVVVPRPAKGGNPEAESLFPIGS